MTYLDEKSNDEIQFAIVSNLEAVISVSLGRAWLLFVPQS